MTATVEPTSIARRFRAWCEVHQDGWNGTKKTAQKWADKHNAEHHPEPPAPQFIHCGVCKTREWEVSEEDPDTTFHDAADHIVSAHPGTGLSAVKEGRKP